MTNQEFSLGFDILWNNIMSNAAPGLNIYEKSFLLTKAQEEIIKNYFNPKGNKYLEGFDQNRKREIDFSMIISESSITTDSDSTGLPPDGFSCSLPDDIMFILNETCSVSRDNVTKNLVVVPISYQEYTRLMNKTYKAPYKWQCWRLFITSGETPQIKLMPGYGYSSCTYGLRYIRNPRPIILGNLEDGLTINGLSTESVCELSSEIHQEILERAVEIGKVIWSGNDQLILESGKRSE